MAYLLVLFSLFLGLFGLSAQAQEKDLGEVVVTATRAPEPVKDLPVVVQVIDRKTIETSGAKSLSELLAKEHAGHLHTYPGLLSSVGIRGFRTDTHGTNIKGRVLILIDGHRAGTGNVASIPLENVARIEIVRGPGSVVYGSAAMGGVINIITRKGKGRPSVSYGIEGGENSFIKGNAGFQGSFLNERLSFSFTGRTTNYTDYEPGDSDHEYDNTAYKDEAYAGSLALRLAENQEIMAVWNYFRAWDVGTPGATYSPDPDNYKDVLRRYFSLAYEGKDSQKGLFWHLSYYYVWDRSEWHDPARAWGFGVSTTRTETKGLRLNARFPTFSFGNLIIGFDYDRIDVDFSRDVGAPYSPNSQYDNWAIFAEEKLTLREKAILYLGLRYDYFDEELKHTPGLTISGDKDEDFDHVSLRGGLRYFLNDYLAARVAVGTAFRIPTADELSGRFERPWSKITGNPDLDPEKSTTLEGGLDFERWGLSLSATYFYTWYDDRIVSGVPTCVDGDCDWITYDNVDGAKISGLELMAQGKFQLELAEAPFTIVPRFNLVLYTKRKIDDADWRRRLASSTVPYISSANLNADLDFYWRRFHLNLNAFYVGSQKVQDWDWNSPHYRQNVHKGGFTVFSGRLEFSPYRQKGREIKFYLGADNLFDKRYSFVKGYPMPGRWIKVGLSGTF